MFSAIISPLLQSADMVAGRTDVRITYHQSFVVSKGRMRCQEAVQPIFIIYAFPLPSMLLHKCKKEMNERNLVKLVAMNNPDVQTRVFCCH
jgi:hypothetical protein